MRRSPPNTTPAQQATGATHTTGPYSFLFDTPNSHRLVRTDIRGSYASCGMARARRDAAVQDQFRGHSAIISRRKKLNLASLRPTTLTAILRATDEKENPMPYAE